MKVVLGMDEILELVLDGLTFNDGSGDPHEYLPPCFKQDGFHLVATTIIDDYGRLEGIEITSEKSDGK